MHKKLYLLFFILMGGVINCNTEYKGSSQFEPIPFYAEYNEWVAFEEYLKTDASAEIKALVNNIERDFVLLLQVYAALIESAIQKNSPLLIEHSKDSTEIIDIVFNDLMEMINEVNSLSKDLIFNEAERDAMQAAEKTEYMLYVKKTLEEFIALVDTIQEATGHLEAPIAFLRLNPEKKQQVYARFRPLFAQKAALSQQVFANSLSILKIAIPEFRSLFYKVLDSSVQFAEITECGADNFVYFMDARLQNLLDLYNQLALEFGTRKFGKYEGKNTNEMSHEEIIEVLELYAEFAHTVKIFAKQLLVETEIVS